MDDEGLQIPISLTMDAARESMRALEAEAVASGKTVKAGLEQGSRGVEEAGSALSRFAREQRAEARTARFFVSEFAAFLPVGSASREVLMSLTGALVGGFGLGAGLEVVALGVKLFTDYLKEEEAASKKAREAAQKHADALGEIAKSAEDFIFAQQKSSAALGWFRGEMAKVRDEAVPFTRKIAEAQQILEDIAKGEYLKKHGLWAAMSINTAKAEAEKAIRDSEQALAQLDARAATVEAKYPSVKGAESGKAQREWQQKHREQMKEWRAEELRELAAFNAKIAAEEEKEVEREIQRYIKRDELRKQAKVTARSFGEAGGDLGKASQLQALYTETAQKLALIESMETEGVLATQQAEAMRTAYTREESTKRLGILRTESEATKRLKDMGVDAARSLASSVAAELGKTLTSSRAYANAMKAAGAANKQTADLSIASVMAMTQGTLAAVAQRASVEALFELAMGLRDTAMGLPTAAAHFASAQMFGATAALAGAGALAIGAGRGMTAAERADVAGAEEERRRREEGERRGLTDRSGPREVGASPEEQAAAREKIVIYVGDPFMTPAENAAAIARRLDLVERLDLRRRSA